MIELPAHTSFSSLSSYGRCAKAWQLERVVKVPQSPGWARIGGSAVHTATERADLGVGVDGGALGLFDQAMIEEIDAAYAESPDIESWTISGRASRDWPDKENELWWWANGPLMVQRWIEWRERMSMYTIADIDGSPGVEYGTIPTIGGMPVKMFIDRIFLLPSGEPLIVDLKTGANKQPSNLQLGLYAEGIRQATGVRPRYGAYWDARSGEITGMALLDEFTPMYLAMLISRFDKAVKAELFSPTPGPLCRSCSVNKACALYGGADAAQYDPDYKLMRSVA